MSEEKAVKETRVQEDHPDELTTAVYLEGRLPPDALRTFESHLARCDACRAGIALLRSAGSAGEAAPREFIARAKQAGDPGSPARRWLTPPRAAGLAASLLIVAALAAYLSPSTPPRGAATYRGGGAGGFEDLVPSAGSTAPAGAIVFRWSRVRGADRYVIDVHSAYGENLASFTVPAGTSSAHWPSGVPGPRPGTLIWRIRALALDRVLAESRPIAFEAR
jgi:anti-sigma factor RsiW